MVRDAVLGRKPLQIPARSVRVLNPVDRNESGSKKAKRPHMDQPGGGWASEV